MLRHELSLLGGRVPAGERREFFERMSEAYRAHRRGDEPALGSRALELRARLVERGDYRAYQALERSLELRKAPKKRAPRPRAR